VSALWAALAGAVAAAVVAVVAIRAAPQVLLVTNLRGERVPAVLGVAFVAGAGAGAAVWLLVSDVQPSVVANVAAWGAIGLVGTAGLLDDVAGHRARGFRGHLGSLARGQVTTGIVKLLVGIGVGVTLAVLAGGGPLRVAASAVLIVVSINLWNALDVAPGRALKLGIVALAAVVASGLGRPVEALAAAGLGAAVGLLPFDLAERGMLGDTGSNPLGLVAGLGLALVLPTWGVVVAAVAGLALQVAAETVTISRLVEAVPPLRWFDRLGRRA
jgi:UDP-GlcNAc:undecaprenyl-phosphate/decaprenyl-phosphate GlcNAc-1-phosphate transferase